MRLPERGAVITGEASGTVAFGLACDLGTDTNIASLLERNAPLAYWNLFNKGMKE